MPDTIILTDHLSPGTMALLETAPQNPTLRGLILAECNLWLPDTLTKPGEIKQWITTELAKRPAPAPAPPTPNPFEITPRPARPPAANAAGVNVELYKTETAFGTARFTANATGNMIYTINAEFIRNILTDGNVDSWNDLLSYLREDLTSVAQEEIETEVDRDTVTTRDYETTDCEDTEVSIQTAEATIMRDVKGFMQRHMRDDYNRIAGIDDEG